MKERDRDRWIKRKREREREFLLHFQGTVGFRSIDSSREIPAE